MNNNAITVSVLVLTYNSDKNRLIRTIRSALIQQGVAFEIVVSDDGSKESIAGFLEGFFEENGFRDYRIVENAENGGTVMNYYRGLQACRGRFVKAIGPGDCLCAPDTLSRWVAYLEEGGLRWSFSEVINYRLEGERIVASATAAHPNDREVYLKGSENRRRWQFLVLNDLPVGASMLAEKELQLTYCEEILHRIVFMEDAIWRLMMFDGIVGGFFPEHAVLYEVGEGISTNGTDHWRAVMLKDRLCADGMIFSRTPADRFQARVQRAIRLFDGHSKLKKVLLIKGFLFSRLRKQRLSSVPGPEVR